MHTMNHSRTLSCTPEKGYHQGMDKTLRYYDENAAAFTADTVTTDMGAIQEAFIRQLHPGAHILDLGCGSGRDSKLFLSKGFAVTPVDGSAEMCTSAKANTGLEVRQLLFKDLQLGTDVRTVVQDGFHAFLKLSSGEVQLHGVDTAEDHTGIHTVTLAGGEIQYSPVGFGRYGHFRRLEIPFGIIAAPVGVARNCHDSRSGHGKEFCSHINIHGYFPYYWLLIKHDLEVIDVL